MRTRSIQFAFYVKSTFKSSSGEQKKEKGKQKENRDEN